MTFAIPNNLHQPTIFTTLDLGKAIRAARKALGKTQAALAGNVGCRRQPTADLGAGRNVTVRLLLAALSGLGKRIEIVGARPELGRLQMLLDDPNEE